MLDLKAKLLAAGLVTSEQVQKVETEVAEKKARDKERRQRQDEAPRRDGPRRDGPRRDGPHADARRDGPRPDARRAGPRPEGNRPAKPAFVDERPDFVRKDPPPGANKRKDKRPDPDDPHEKAARREHEMVEAERWRKRLDELKAAGKSTQYETIRGWVLRFRMDSKFISDRAERYHFMRADGNLSHLTIEPDLVDKLAAGEAALVAYMGFNGLEHTVVPKDVALDIQAVRPDWLRALVGVTDALSDATKVEAEAAAVAADAEAAVAADAAAAADAATASEETEAVEATEDSIVTPELVVGETAAAFAAGPDDGE